MSNPTKSNKAGYDVLHNPIAPNLLFNIGDQPESVYLYTPHVIDTGNGWNLVWTNNAGLDNPPTIHIVDGEKGNNGTTFTPHVTSVTDGYTLSWTNDTGEENPPSVTILNGADGAPGAPGQDGAPGATYTPHIEEVTNGVKISWTNNAGLPNPQDVTLTNGHNGIDGQDGTDGTDGVNGVTYTPHVTQTQNGYELSWTNDGSQTNPPTVSLTNGTDGVSPTASIQRVTGGAEITVTDGTGTTTAFIPDGTPGTNGTDGVGISTILFKETDASGNNVYTITLTDNRTYDIVCPRGPAGGGGGTSDYTDLTNKPQINGVTLSGNKTGADLGLDKVVEVTQAQYDAMEQGGTLDPSVAYFISDGAAANDGLPTGGTTGQVLRKNSSTNYDAVWDTLGTAADKDYTDLVRPNNHNLVESNAVYNAINSALSSIYTARGEITVAELVPALLVESNVGSVWETTDSGVTTEYFMQGAGVTIPVGQNVGIVKAGPNTYLFNLMSNSFDLTRYQTKDLETPVTIGGVIRSTVQAAISAIATFISQLSDRVSTTETALSGKVNGAIPGRLDISPQILTNGQIHQYYRSSENPTQDYIDLNFDKNGIHMSIYSGGTRVTYYTINWTTN